MKLSKILLSGVFVLAALTGCTQDKNAIIKVNNEPITKSQYEEVYARETSSPQYQQFASYLKDENSIMSLMLKDRIVNELILKEIINQEIEKRKIEVTDEEIQARKDEITEKIGPKEKVEELLKRNNVSDKQFD